MPDSSGATGVCVILVTCPSRPVGERIGRALVESRLAACVNILPGVRSIYRWEGKIQRDPEVLLMIKTRRRRLAALQRTVKSLHPYTVPEIIALPVIAGSAAYLAWVKRSST